MRRLGLAVWGSLTISALGCAQDHEQSQFPERRCVEGGASCSAPQEAGPRSAERFDDATSSTTPVVDGCDYNGSHYIFGERFIDTEACLSCRCENYGQTSHVQCDSAMCDEGDRCDGGPCTSCRIGEQTFPVGTGLTCDACNECTCTGLGSWLSTLVLCSELPPLQRCPQPTAASTVATSLIYLDSSPPGSIALRGRFPRGGCGTSHELRGCYAFEDAKHVRIWLELANAPADCEVAFIEEGPFDVSSVRGNQRRGSSSEHGSLTLEVGDQTFDYAF